MKNHRRRSQLVCLTLLASVWAAVPARADVISQWNEQVPSVGRSVTDARHGAGGHVRCDQRDPAALPAVP